MRLLHRRRPTPARSAEPLHPRLAALDLLREKLGADTVGRALMLDEPLASRGVDATLRALELAPEPVSLRAVRDARAAYDQRSNR